MLVEVYKETKNRRSYEHYFDTDDLSDEDYVEFRRLWDSDKLSDKIQARQYLAEHV